MKKVVRQFGHLWQYNRLEKTWRIHLNFEVPRCDGLPGGSTVLVSARTMTPEQAQLISSLLAVPGVEYLSSTRYSITFRIAKLFSVDNVKTQIFQVLRLYFVTVMYG